MQQSVPLKLGFLVVLRPPRAPWTPTSTASSSSSRPSSSSSNLYIKDLLVVSSRRSPLSSPPSSSAVACRGSRRPWLGKLKLRCPCTLAPALARCTHIAHHQHPPPSQAHPVPLHLKLAPARGICLPAAVHRRRSASEPGKPEVCILRLKFS